MAGQSTPRHSQAAANGAPTLTPLGHYAGRPNIPISRTVTLVGSRHDARLHLHSSTVSKAHCLIVNTVNGAYVRDLASRTKVIINGKPQRETDLHDGDKVQIGKFEFQFNAGTNVRPGKPMSFDPAPPAALHVEGAEMPLPIEDRVLVIGRRTICDVPLTEESVSTTHAVILEMNGQRYVRDLGSRTGTFVNGRAIQQQAELKLGDELRIGETSMRYAPARPSEEVHDLDNMIAPAASATGLDASPLDDLAAAAAATPDQLDAEIEVEPEPADQQVPLEDVPVAQEVAEPAAEAPAAQDATTAAIEEELGLSPSLDARSGWRSRLLEEDEQRKPAEAPRDEAVVAPPLAAPEPQPEPQAEAAPEPQAETPQELELETLPPLDIDLGPEVEAEAEPEAQNVPPAETPLPGVAELADLARAEAPAEKDVETVEEEIKPAAPVADTADVSVTDEENIHDEVPPSPVALQEPSVELPEIDLGELPALELTDAPRDDASDAAVAATIAGETGADSLELSLLPSDSEIGTDDPSDATLELKLPDVDEPAAPQAPDVTPEPIDDDTDRAAQRRRRLRRRRGEPVEINLPERTGPDAPAPAPAAEAENVEVIDHTQPTPESAQSLEDAVADLLSEPALGKPEETTVDAAELTDTAFGRNVEAFAGESTGPLVEARAEETKQPEPAAQDIEVPVEDVSVEPVDETWLHDTPFAAEQPAAAAIEGDTAGQAAAETTADSPEELAAAEALAIEALAATTNAETIDISPDEAASAAPPPLHQQAPEDVGEPIVDVEVESPVTEQKREPVAEAPKSAPKIDLTGWGPNQEHFLGGMPLKLNEPAPRQQQPRPAAEAPRATPPRPSKAQPPLKRSPFEITPNDVPAEDYGRGVPPYAGTNPKKGRVTTGFDGLAMPPVRQVDVFSQMATPAAFVNGIVGDEDVFGGKTGAVPAQHAAPIVGARYTPLPQEKQPASRGGGGSGGGEPPRPGKGAPTPEAIPDEWDETSAEAPVAAQAPVESAKGGRQPAARGQVPPIIPPNAADAYAVRPRKRRWFGLGGLLIMMLVCMGAAVVGIYAFVPPRAVVQGSLAFRNFTALNEMGQRELKSRQQQLLAAPELRENASAILRTGEPDATPGFLSDDTEFSRIVSGMQWNGGTLVLRRDGSSPRLDQARLFAVLTALYQSNGDLVEDARKLRGQVDALADAHAKAQQRATELKASIERSRAAAEDRPLPAEIAALEEEAAKLETAWSDAVAASKNIEIDLKRTREGLSPTPQPAGTAAVPVVDPQLAQLERSLSDINTKIAALQQAQSTKAQDARKELDAALEAFEKEVAGATAAVQAAPAGPELTAYLAEAQKLRQSTRELTDTLIHRQQQQTEKLTELKSRLNEKREVRRTELVKKDPELRKWNDELAIAQRQHSAAVSAGLKNDAEEYAAHVSTLQKMIAARQSLIGDDAFYAEAINELEKIIAETTKSIETDRQATETKFEENQKALVQAQPAAQKLTPEQQALASNLMERLAAVTAARHAYTAAAAGGSADSSDEQMQKLRDDAATLVAKLAERKKQLTAASEKTQLAAEEQGHMSAVKQKEAELAAARETERNAQAAWASAVKKVNAAQARVASAREAGEKFDEAKRELDVANKDIEQSARSHEAAAAQLAKKVDPLPPEEKDVRVEPGTNVRPTYALFAVGGIAALFTVLILFSVKSERSAAAAAARALGDDDWGDPTAPLLPAGEVGTNGNGHTDSREKPGRHGDESRVPV